MGCKESDMKREALVVVHEIFVCHVGSFVAACRLCLWVPESSASVLAPHGLSCFMTWDPSSPTRVQTHDPCIGRQILNHWTTRKVP